MSAGGICSPSLAPSGLYGRRRFISASGMIPPPIRASMTPSGPSLATPRLAAAGEHVRIPWARVLSSLNTFLLAATMSASAILFYMEFQWYPTYLKEGRGVSQIGSGWLTGAVISGGAAGCVAGGLLSDFVLRHTKDRNWSYRWCGGICLLFAAISV